jgi:predicted Zn-dependent peptidase
MHALGARLEHTSEIADSARSLFTQQLPPDYYAKYPELVAKISTAEVARQAARLDPSHLLVVLVGDRAQIEPSIKQHGFELESVDPALLE